MAGAVAGAEAALAGAHDVEVEAATALANAYKKMPGVVGHLISGQTVAEVEAAYAAAQQAYADVKADVLADLGVAVPGAHASGGAGPVPTDPFDMIRAGIGQTPAK